MKLLNLCFCVTMSKLSLFAAAVKLCMVFWSTVMEVLIKSSFAISLSSSRWRPAAPPCLLTFESRGGGGVCVTVVFSAVCKEISVWYLLFNMQWLQYVITYYGRAKWHSKLSFSLFLQCYVFDNVFGVKFVITRDGGRHNNLESTLPNPLPIGKSWLRPLSRKVVAAAVGDVKLQDMDKDNISYSCGADMR